MSETIHTSWQGEGSAPLGRAFEALGEALELARLELAAASQAREMARLTKEFEASAGQTVVTAESFVPMMKSHWSAIWRKVGCMPDMSWNFAGDYLRAVFDQVIGMMESARDSLASDERTLGRPLGSDRVERALLEARQMRTDLDTNWLWFTKESEEDAKAAIARGEGMDVEEAFAQMAGVTVEELRAKVEAHKRKYHPTGNGAR